MCENRTCNENNDLYWNSFHIYFKSLYSVVAIMITSVKPLWMFSWRCVTRGFFFSFYHSEPLCLCTSAYMFVEVWDAINMFSKPTTMMLLWCPYQAHAHVFGALLQSNSAYSAMGSFQYDISSNQYRDSHCKDKTVSSLFYLYNGESLCLERRFLFCKSTLTVNDESCMRPLLCAMWNTKTKHKPSEA